MSLNNSADSLRGTLASTASVVLVIFATSTVAIIAFDSYPWVAILFGLLLIGIARQVQGDIRKIIPLVYAMYGTVMIVLGVIATLYKVFS